MKLLRRNFLKLAGALIAAPALPRLASALDYPTRPTKIVAGFAAGGGVDITARLIGQWLADHLGQPFVVENRTGAGGNIGTETVVNAAPDGYTLLLATVPNAVNASLYEKLNFNFVRDIAPVAGVIRVPMVVLVHPAVPAQTLAEFIAYAKANPGKVNMASAGSGSAPHMAGELFKMMDRRRHGPCPLSRPGAGALGFARRPGADPVCGGTRHRRPRQDRQAARARGDHGRADAGSA
jgi:tripartite-type tricarboxylate transporter receptor subunit TctC